MALTQDNPQQQQSLIKIDQLITQKFEELETTIELHKKGKVDEAIQIVLSDEGKLIMDNLRIEMGKFISEKNRLLEIRHDEYHRVQTGIVHTFTVESALFAFLIIVLVWMVKKNLITPITKLTDTANHFRFHTEFRPIYLENKDEIGILASAFNAMGEEINKSAKIIL